jgi:hypothetical protein
MYVRNTEAIQLTDQIISFKNVIEVIPGKLFTAPASALEEVDRPARFMVVRLQ